MGRIIREKVSRRANIQLIAATIIKRQMLGKKKTVAFCHGFIASLRNSNT